MSMLEHVRRWSPCIGMVEERVAMIIIHGIFSASQDCVVGCMKFLYNLLSLSYIVCNPHSQAICKIVIAHNVSAFLNSVA